MIKLWPIRSRRPPPDPSARLLFQYQIQKTIHKAQLAPLDLLLKKSLRNLEAYAPAEKEPTDLFPDPKRQSTPTAKRTENEKPEPAWLLSRPRCRLRQMAGRFRQWRRRLARSLCLWLLARLLWILSRGVRISLRRFSRN